jgi:hypothetical protein
LLLIANLVGFVNGGKIGLVVKGLQNGELRGYAALPGSQFQSDRAGEVLTFSEMLALAGPGEAMTYTAVPRFSETRIGIDRDLDGYFDGDERDACSDPADASSTPLNVVIDGDSTGDGQITWADYAAFHPCFGGPGTSAEQDCVCTFDFDQDGDLDLVDYSVVQIEFDGL